MRNTSITTLVVVGLMMSLLPLMAGDGQAETYGIGDEVSRIEPLSPAVDDLAIYYSNGTWISGDPAGIPILWPLFDGNRSTNLDVHGNSIPNFPTNNFEFYVMFAQNLYVNKITIYPLSGAGSMLLTDIILPGGLVHHLGAYTNETKTYDINGTLTGFHFHMTSYKQPLDNYHYYYDEIMINYTPNGTWTCPMTDRIVELEKDVDNVTEAVDNHTIEIDALKDNITSIEATQAEILTDLALLWNEIDALSASLADIQSQIDAIEIPPGTDITWIQENLSRISIELESLRKDISVLQNATIEFPATDNSELLILQERMNQTALEIVWLNDNVTALQNVTPVDIPSYESYNDTALLERIRALEAENEAMKLMINESSGVPLDDFLRTHTVPEEDTVEQEEDVWIYALMFIALGVIAIVGTHYLTGYLLERVPKKKGPDIHHEEDVYPPILTPAPLTPVPVVPKEEESPNDGVVGAEKP